MECLAEIPGLYVHVYMTFKSSQKNNIKKPLQIEFQNKNMYHI